MLTQSEKNDTAKELGNQKIYHKNIHEIISECLAQMTSNEIPLNGSLNIEGKIYRFSIGTKKNKNGWYIAWEGISVKGYPYLICKYGSWSTGKKFEYHSWNENTIIDEQERSNLHKALQEKYKAFEKATEAEHERIANECDSIWARVENKQPTAEHLKYLKIKKVQAYGIRFGENEYGFKSIIIPLRNAEGEIRTLQYISVGHDNIIYKSFHAGGEKKGNFFILGEVLSGKPIRVCEGYATGASVHEATTHPVVVAFDSGNLSQVIENIRKFHPNNEISIAADDDRDTFIKEKINPGKDAAEKASKKYGCSFLLPTFKDDFRLPGSKTQEKPDGARPTDFNDLHVHFGLDEVNNQLSNLNKKSYLTTIDLHSFLAKDIPPRRVLLDPWLPEQGLTMIFAKRGIGKTFVALSVAYAIACGDKVLKWKAEKPRRVLYVDGEMPAATMQERLALIAKASEKELPDPSYFKLITPDYQDSGIRDLSTLEGQFDINEHISEVDLLVLDNLSTLVRSGRENESESWLPVQEWALSLRKLGKSVLFIHHAGKAGQQRGTSRKEDVLDSVIELKHPKNYSPEQGARFEVHYEKSRGFDGEDAAPFEASLITNEKGLLEWSVKEIEARDLDRVVDLYNDGMTNQRDIAKELEISLGKVNKLIQEAKKQGLIQ